MFTAGFAMARPDAAIALAKPEGLRFFDEELPESLRRQGIFLPPFCEVAPVDAIDAASDSV
jgi:hypothetical protein